MHLPEKILTQRLDNAARSIEVGASYYHYKQPNHTYTVMQLAIMEATDQPCIIYRANYGEGMGDAAPAPLGLTAPQL